MHNRKVVVTGMGVVSALGCDVSSFWKSLQEGRSGIRQLTSVKPGTLRFPNGAQVDGFESLDHFDEKRLALLDRFAQYAVVAARAAIQHAGITPKGARTAIVTGCSAGGQSAMDEGFVELYQKGSPRVAPMLIPRIMSNGAASHISMEFGITGPTYSVSTACSSSNHAIGQALWLLRSGVCDSALAGGTEAVFSYGFLKSWEAMRVVSPDTCRPFSKDRRGMILGEGAGMLFLETEAAARARGAPIYAELTGFGMSSDAYRVTQPSAEGAAQAMQAALADAGVKPEQVDYINAHGTGTPANDCTETSAIRSVFREHANKLAVSSTKSMHGHALGAAGALEAIATVMALHEGWLPPTANFTEPDPACDLDVVPNRGRAAEVACAVSNSFAFGGLNAVLVFERPNSVQR